MAKKGTTKYKSNLQEKSVAKQFGGKQVIASGALWFAHSDVRNDKFLIECKTTEKGYYSVTNKVWEKIEGEAVKDRMRVPLLIIDLRDRDRYVVFNPSYFEKKVNTYEVFPHVHGGCNSYRLKGYSDENLPILFSVLSLKSKKKNHILMAMKINDFIEHFKEELE